MGYLACGINHKTAPLQLRERVAFGGQTNDLLEELTKQSEIKEAALLSTCNRTEIYCVTDNIAYPAEWLVQKSGLPIQEIQPCLYLHEQQDAVRHAMRVASGLDSMVLGEPQILGQMKAAYQQGMEVGSIGTLLGRLFEKVFSTSKQVRNNTSIGENPVSVAYAAVDIAKHVFADIEKAHVLLIGAGETIELCAKYLKSQGVKNIVIANRTLHRSRQLAGMVGGRGITIAQIPEVLATSDIVISATASQLPILGKGMMERMVKARRHKPVVMLDLAMPRDIEPEVGGLSDVYLYNLDDLHKLIQNNLKSREQAALQAETIIDMQSVDFMHAIQTLDAGCLIQTFRGKAERERDAALEKAKQMLANGAPVEEVLERLAYGLTNKLIHCPTLELRHASAEDDQKTLQFLRRLFDL